MFYHRLKLQNVILRDQKLEISEGVGLFEVFETKKSGILGHRKSSERFSAAGKKASPSLRRPLLKSRGLLFSGIKYIYCIKSQKPINFYTTLSLLVRLENGKLDNCGNSCNFRFSCN